MMQFTPHRRIIVGTHYVDLRKGFDALAGYCRDVLAADPFSGTIFVFTNRARTHLRLLFYDGQGLWLCTKRLSRGRFPWWPGPGGGGDRSRQLGAHQMQLLIWGGNGDEARVLEDWRRFHRSFIKAVYPGP